MPKTPKICKEINLDVSPTPKSIAFTANACGGDDEFGGAVYISCVGALRLSVDQRTVLCNIKFNADEVDGGTHACFEKDYEIYTADSGLKIKSILTPTTYNISYKHDDEEPRGYGGDGFIESAVFRGDHEGSDIGYTGGTLQLATIRVTLIEEDGECISKDVFMTAHKAELKSFNPKMFVNINAFQSLVLKSIEK